MLDLNKPVQTRDGRKARVICRDAKIFLYPVVALVQDENGEEWTHFLMEDGSFYDSNATDALDLVNAPEETVRYVNVWVDGCWSHKTRRSADEAAGRREGLLKLTFDEGKLVKAEVL